jgi:hypothetical protein
MHENITYTVLVRKYVAQYIMDITQGELNKLLLNLVEHWMRKLAKVYHALPGKVY